MYVKRCRAGLEDVRGQQVQSKLCRQHLKSHVHKEDCCIVALWFCPIPGLASGALEDFSPFRVCERSTTADTKQILEEPQTERNVQEA